MVIDAAKNAALKQGINPTVQENFKLYLKKIQDTWRSISGLGVFHFVEQVTLAY